MRLGRLSNTVSKVGYFRQAACIRRALAIDEDQSDWHLADLGFAAVLGAASISLWEMF